MKKKTRRGSGGLDDSWPGKDGRGLRVARVKGKEGLSVTLPGLPSASGKIEEASEDGRGRSTPPGGSLSTKEGDEAVLFVKINGPRKQV